MGRWAQQKRRGGRGDGASLSSTVYIVSVRKVTADTVEITWSNTVNCTVGVTSTNVFNVAGNDSINVTQAHPTVIQVQMEAAVNVGDTWHLTGQPPFVVSPTVFAGSGLVT